MKKIFGVLTCYFLCSGFLSQGPHRLLYPDYYRRQPLRPYPYKYLIANISLRGQEKYNLKFYDNTNRAKVLLELNDDGIFWGGEKICEWGKDTNPTSKNIGVSKDCPDDLPIGSEVIYTSADQMMKIKDATAYERKQGRMNYGKIVVEIDSVIHESLGGNISGQDNEQLLIIKFRGKEAVASISDLKKQGWIKFEDTSPAFIQSYHATEKILKNDNDLVDVLEGIDKCFNGLNQECVGKYLSLDDFIVITDNRRHKDDYCYTDEFTYNLENHLKCLFDMTHRVFLDELKLLFKRRDFPCVFYSEKNRRGGNVGQVLIYGSKLGAVLGQNENKEWKIKSIFLIDSLDSYTPDEYSKMYCYRLGEKPEDYYDNNVIRLEPHQTYREMNKPFDYKKFMKNKKRKK